MHILSFIKFEFRDEFIKGGIIGSLLGELSSSLEDIIELGHLDRSSLKRVKSNHTPSHKHIEMDTQKNVNQFNT
jgi:hypothetical protein